VKIAASSEPIRVLHLVHWLNPGGIENWLLNVSRFIDRQNLQIDICCKGPKEGTLAPDFRKYGTKVFHCPQNFNIRRFQKQLQSLLREGSYDILHVHTQVHSGPAVHAAKHIGLPTVTTFHSSGHQPETRFTKLPLVRDLRLLYAKKSIAYALRSSTICTGVSSDTIRAVTEFTNEKCPDARVLYLGVPRSTQLSLTEIATLKNSLQLPAQAKVILHVGSFRPQKNHSTLLKAFHLIHKSDENAHLLLAGDGPDKQKIISIIDDLNIRDRVHLLGMRSDVPNLMQLATLFLFPSHVEGLSLSLVEALANKLPIVCSNIPGNKEATNNGEFATLHNPEDYQSFAKSVLKYFQSSKHAMQSLEKARVYFEKNFSLEASIASMRLAYQSALHTSVGQQLSKNAA
jgi:glycosyltransferase EpsF